MTVGLDGGIVQGYIEQFLQLGVKASSGENVNADVRELVKKALAQMNVWVDGDKLENKRALVGRLKMHAELIAQSNPIQARVLMDAHEQAASMITSR